MAALTPDFLCKICDGIGGNMIVDIMMKLLDLSVENDKTLSERLHKRAKNLEKLECNNKEIGKWIEDFELPALIEILNSRDNYFPRSRAFNFSERKKFAVKIQKHCKTCPRCK